MTNAIEPVTGFRIVDDLSGKIYETEGDARAAYLRDALKTLSDQVACLTGVNLEREELRDKLSGFVGQARDALRAERGSA